ncbi:multidrug efflux MFS transporter [Lactobacillus kefiranofaciens]|mgnify:FL=1|uniref:MFS transporter, DHA1 family, multidrug resistance protein n=1 Tax=Lactobacillus kefiranofaciens TaxID=267818 RepID=A0AAX3UH63_9LACO|nr:multidrug efflux MFS transporter [Lactobacillus kefiranofaciens]AEG40762.1 MFS family major facilitator transporter [Lactobacillus kefiranofaciens subsp. kefiranofaciens]KRL24868.1 MFS family major facilitator transporter [Lactobacillus kefiranofaciens subsp. kefirgranum DSM 10550 = JCM 8572]KRM22798.1 MFS family major facilitator transporter [Lactobacillus kefiranofaciens subsp. kefiranofaciens DSM 5016 = JCM 6985]MCJ2171808.1 multidrug efflux MFS transporter [Lactobacillus kefiranofaciens]
MTEKTIWKKNLFVLSIAVFIAGIAFSEIMPFLSLYINTLGNFSHQQLNFWSGIVYSGTFIISAIVSPWWGKLADKKGRKPMILRAGIGMSIVIASMGLVQNVWQLLLLRMLQGIFAGFISNSNALVATETPKTNSGQALGTIASATTAGTLLGPLVGGALTSIFSYRVTFMITGGLLLICSVLVLFFVHEDDFKPVTAKKLDKASGVIKSLNSPHLIFGLLLTTLIIQAANNSINPIVSLYVRQLLDGHGNVVFISGVIAALPGIATFAVASRFGALGDKIGTHKIIVAGFIAATIFFFLTAFVQNTIELGILRFLVGFSDACLFPQVQTMLTKNSPAAVTGRIFSWNQSAMYIGNIFGPLLGSTISGLTNYSTVFLVTAGIVVFNLILFKINVINNLN